MRILQVLPHLSKGGAERIVIDLSNTLIEEGHNVTLLLALQADPVLNQQFLSENVLVKIVSPNKTNRFWPYLLLPIWVIKHRKLLKTYDVVHCHLTYGLFFGFVFSIFRKIEKLTNIRLIATCHIVGIRVSRRLRFINERLSLFFDAFVLMAMDNQWRTFIAEGKRKNVQVIPNGISPFSTPNSDSSLLNLQSEKFEQVVDRNFKTIGTISRLESERKPWLFLEVFAEVQKLMDFEVRFILGGEGPESEFLKKLAKELELSKSLTMPGLIQDPHTVLTVLDLYVTLNVEETTGIAGLEAVFSGVPVVGIQLSREYARGGKDWIWSNQNPQLVGKEIVTYLKNPKQLQAMAESQFLLANEKYSLIRMREEYLGLYRPLNKNI